MSTKVDNKKYFLFFNEVDLNKLVMGSDYVSDLIDIAMAADPNREFIITDKTAKIIYKGKY